MAKTVLYVLGAVLTLVGVLGFVMESPLLGFFEVDMLHSIVHLVSGVVFLSTAAYAASNAQMVAKIFGVVYAVVAVLGFVLPDILAGMMAVNMADHVLHAALALVLLYAGFMGEKAMDEMA